MTPTTLRRAGHWRTFPVLLLALLFVCGSLQAGEAQAWYEKISSDLQNQIERQSDEIFRVLVVLKDRVNTNQIRGMSPYRDVRHELIVSSLQQKAEQTQVGLLRYLEQQKQINEVRRYRSFWITNLVAVEAGAGVVTAIANRPEVEMVYLDYPVESIEPVSVAPSPGDSPGSAEPGLRDINAHKLWEIGITGEGVIVSNCDTGVDGAHPALAARWRGLEPGVDPHWAWYSVDNPTQTFPVDYGYHGTHTMGTLTGLDPNTADTIGVAVGAQWIATAWDYTTLNKFISDVIDEYNWLADPDGDPGTTDDVPAVVSNSWGVGVIFGQPPCDESFWEAIDNVEAAGAAVVFAAGNEGSGAQTLRAPADRNTTPTNCFSVGALNPGSTTIATFSSRGPTACPGTTEERIKPEVCARGVSVRSAYPGGSYINLDGTSMACPHVAGGLALLRDAFPNATVDELKTALMETAVDLGTTGEDNDYGHGRIDLWAAYNSLQGSGILSCGDLTSFVARCVGGQTVQARVRASGGWTGTTVTISIDGSPNVINAQVKPDNSASQWKLQVSGVGPGMHTISLKDPTGCYSDVIVDCGADEPSGWEWEDDASWGTSDLDATVAPTATKIVGNYPNPFNPSTTIRYQLAEETNVSVKVFNMLGQEVATLVNGVQRAGEQSVVWHGTNDFGQAVSSGLYIYRIQAGNLVLTDKMMFMK